MRCRGQQQMAGTRQHDTIEDLMLFEKLHPQVDQPAATGLCFCCGTAMQLPFRLGSDFFFRTSPCLKSISNQFNTYRPIPKPQLPFKTRVTFCQEAVDLPSRSPPLKPQTNSPRSLGPAWNSEDQLGVGTGLAKKGCRKMMETHQKWLENKQKLGTDDGRPANIKGALRQKWVWLCLADNFRCPKEPQ